MHLKTPNSETKCIIETPVYHYMIIQEFFKIALSIYYVAGSMLTAGDAMNQRVVSDVREFAVWHMF